MPPSADRRFVTISFSHDHLLQNFCFLVRG
ncbi:hypothetical protein NMG60_11033660 [Bertholletia excelsa]